jgi:hypothetical protein
MPRANPIPSFHLRKLGLATHPQIILYNQYISFLCTTSASSHPENGDTMSLRMSDHLISKMAEKPKR